ncbi:Alpha/Beta hydrolase protein [Aspergillus cavernicola]|uniref:Alpha/Beta hydrolase protein n=1 Tax=Aspergillus cavernicola TaxID=176166 RepID=A0ABR4HS21_9EURO
MPCVQVRNLDLLASKAKVFYREAGPEPAPVILLLHGFPSSSHQRRNLIPILAKKYRVLAPDLPGFGFTEVPEEFQYTFDNLTTVISEFLDQLSVQEFSIFIFNYGAPTGLRLALQRPDAVQAIITQNGNAYEEGLREFWDKVRDLWTEQQ